MSGYIKIHRKLIDWGWYSDPTTKVVFLHLLLTANYKESEFKGQKIAPGQTVVGVKALAEKLGLTVQNVRTALSHLEASGEITRKSTNRFSVVTIANWGKYQLADDELTNNQQSTNNQLTNNQQSTNNQLTTLEERKKVRKEESKTERIITPLTPLTDCGEELQEAVRRWLAYKQERGQAYKQVGLDTLIKKIKKSAIQYGESVVVDLIDECIANRYQGIIWERIQKRQPKEQDRLAWLDEIDWSGADDN